MYFLCDRKYQRTGQSCTAFGASFVHKLHQLSCCNILQSVHTSPLTACRYVWGGKNSLRSNIMPPVSKHCSAAHCASQRCPLDKLLMLAAKAQTSLAFARLHVTFRLWRGITFAMKIYWNVSRTLTRTMVISKKHRQCQNHNGNPCCLEAIVRGTSKRSTAIIFS